MNLVTSIEKEQAALLAKWEEAARAEVHAARETNSLALRDHLPFEIEDIITALKLLPEVGDPREAAQQAFRADHSNQHGRHRASTQGYTVEQVIHEYMILRRVITDVVLSKADCRAEEVETIAAVLELDILTAVREFVNSMEEVQWKLMGSLVHDIRTPLSVASTALALIEEQSEEKELVREFQGLAMQSIRRAAEMINGLMDTVVTAAGSGMMLNFEDGSFTEELNAFCREADRIYSGRVIKVVPEHDIAGVFDPAAFRRILENLVSNAFRYGAHGKPIRISLEDAHKSVVLSVHNEGEPIPKKQHQQIFEFFSTPIRRTQDGSKRWGVGLSFVKVATEGHKGTISLESSKKGGTTFSVKLPKFPLKPGKVRTQLM